MTPSLRRLRGRVRGDAGASLVMVMAFVVAVGLVTTALLGYAQTGITSAAHTAARHTLGTDAAGAMDVAINSLRNTDYADSSQPCPAPFTGTGTGPRTMEVNLTTAGGDPRRVRVVCSPEPGTGTSAGVVPISALNRPGSAVLTLGSGSSHVGFSKGSNGVLRIKGRVYVNSAITVDGTDCPSTNCSQINVTEAPVIARGNCPATSTNKLVSTVSVACNSTTSPPPPEGKDPRLLTDADIPNGTAIGNGYEQPPSGVAQLVHRTVPATCPGSGIVTFDPGYYDDAVTLSSFTNTCSRPFHFRPGVYYFDFRNEEVGSIASGSRPVPSGTNVWTINNSAARIVGGTLTPAAHSAIPGSCVSPLTTTVNNNGVQFIFGGSSRLDVQAGHVELCGQYAVDRPALLVFGAKTGTTTVAPLRGSVATASTTPIVSPELAFTNAAQAATENGSPATVTIPRNAATPKASIRLTGMDAASQIPPGSILVSAKLRVTHKESVTRSQDDLTVSVQPNPARAGTAPTVTTSTVAKNGGALNYATEEIDLTNTLMREVWRYGLSDLRTDFTVQAAGPNGSNTTLTTDLDAVQLWLEWKPPSLRGQTEPINGSNCVGAGTTCPLIQTNGSQTKLYLQGTTYAVNAHFNINLTNISGQVFKSGIVARSLAMSVTPSAGFVGPVIEIPDETGAGVNMDVYLTAYACPATGACPEDPVAAGLRRIGRSSISMESAYPVPTTGSRAVTVKSWNVLG